DAQDQARVARGQRLRGGHALRDGGLEAGTVADEAHAHPAAVQLDHLAVERVEEELHERADLLGRAATVLAREREQRQRGHAALEAVVDAQVHRARAGAVADHARAAAARGPAPVAVHYDGDVAGDAGGR